MRCPSDGARTLDRPLQYRLAQNVSPMIAHRCSLEVPPSDRVLEQPACQNRERPWTECQSAYWHRLADERSTWAPRAASPADARILAGELRTSARRGEVVGASGPECEESFECRLERRFQASAPIGTLEHADVSAPRGRTRGCAAAAWGSSAPAPAPRASCYRDCARAPRGSAGAPSRSPHS